MKIVADENIPFLQGVLEPYADVVYAPAAAINAALLHDADALLIRTRTHCDATLLENSPVRFIATATVGADHIDTDYCLQHHIAVYAAVGSNAAAVAQYVVAALCAMEPKTGKKLAGSTLGIIGVGNVGQLVQTAAGALGMHTLLNDPPRAAREGAAGFVSLDELLQQSDIVTLHVPLTADTRQLAVAAFFEKMKPGAAFLNTSRGEVVNEQALLQYRRKLSAVALDVWQHEPHINPAVVAAVDIATPHIAGYSVQGKRNATTMVVQALARFFDIAALKNFALPRAETAQPTSLPCDHDHLRRLVAENYAIFEDDKLLRAHPENFEQLRNNYKLR